MFVCKFINTPNIKYFFKSALSEHIKNLPKRPRPVIADFYTSHKTQLNSILKGLNGKQTLLKIIELYKELPQDEKQILRQRHIDAYKIYQNDLNQILKDLPAKVKSNLIMDGYIKNPKKVNIDVPKYAPSAYAYYMKKYFETETKTHKTGPEYMREAAESWKNLPKEEKTKFVEEWKNQKELNNKEIEEWKKHMSNQGYPDELTELLVSKRGLVALLKAKKKTANEDLQSKTSTKSKEALTKKKSEKTTEKPKKTSKNETIKERNE